MWEMIILKVILPIAVTLIGGWIGAELHKANKVGSENQEKDEGLLALEAAVAQTQVEFVELAKTAAEDGKLTGAEKELAKNLAINKAVELASGPGGAYIVKIGLDAIGGLIEAIIGRNKK